jgi:hypothetical protein
MTGMFFGHAARHLAACVLVQKFDRVVKFGSSRIWILSPNLANLSMKFSKFSPNSGELTKFVKFFKKIHTCSFYHTASVYKILRLNSL